jgi:plastocyanin
MHSRSALFLACVMACTVLAAPRPVCAASALSVTVVNASGAPLAGAVVIAEPAAAAPKPQPGQKAIMDQRNLEFVPEVLVVQAGTAIDFPNSDQVRHQVYSFSDAKKFQLPLYAGRAHEPVIFDRAGLVTLGCNIHDSMVGYIVVTDSPWYGRTDADGTLRLHDLAPGEYTVRVWHQLLDESGPQLSSHLRLTDGATGSVSLRLTRPLRPVPHHHGADKKWEDY